MKKHTTPDPERLLTTDEAAAILTISAGTLKHWTADAKIEHIKVGKFTRFRRATLDRYLEQQTVAARGK